MEGIVLAPQTTLMAHAGAQKLTRQELALVPCPESTDTFKPFPHIELINQLTEALARRQLSILREEYAVTNDGMRMFGIAELTTSANDFRFAIGIRNANNKSMALGLVAGMRIMVCDNMAFVGEFQAILAKHTKNLAADLVDKLSIGVDRIQRNFAPLNLAVDRWKASQLSDDQAKAIIYDAFIGDRLDAPKHIARVVGEHYFEPKYQEFEPRTVWSLQNAFTSSFKELEPYQQFRATASLGKFLQ